MSCNRKSLEAWRKLRSREESGFPTPFKTAEEGESEALHYRGTSIEFRGNFISGYRCSMVVVLRHIPLAWWELTVVRVTRIPQAPLVCYPGTDRTSQRGTPTDT